MAITPLDIANMALGVLDEAPIDSLDQDVKPAPCSICIST